MPKALSHRQRSLNSARAILHHGIQRTAITAKAIIGSNKGKNPFVKPAQIITFIPDSPSLF